MKITGESRAAPCSYQTLPLQFEKPSNLQITGLSFSPELYLTNKMNSSNILARLHRAGSDCVSVSLTMTPGKGCASYAKVVRYFMESRQGQFTRAGDAALCASGIPAMALEWEGHGSEETLIREVGKAQEHWSDTVPFTFEVDGESVETLSAAFPELVAPTTQALGAFSCASGTLTVLEPGMTGDGVVVLPVRPGRWHGALRKVLSPIMYWDEASHQLLAWHGDLGNSVPSGLDWELAGVLQTSENIAGIFDAELYGQDSLAGLDAAIDKLAPLIAGGPLGWLCAGEYGIASYANILENAFPVWAGRQAAKPDVVAVMVDFNTASE